MLFKKHVKYLYEVFNKNLDWWAENNVRTACLVARRTSQKFSNITRLAC